mgnify:CR=1 FL=1
MTIETLKIAFRKLLTYSYFDKNDLVMRRKVAEFAASLSTKEREADVFQGILSLVEGDADETLQELLGQMALMYYPKSIEKPENDSHILTNIPDEETSIKRLLVRCDIPVELLILDVAWILEYGYVLDARLNDNICYANRLELFEEERNGVKKGNAFFKRYHHQYHSWWQNGLDEANKHLTHQEDISIISFDIQNCYHSIDLDFDLLINELDPNLANDRLTLLVRKIYERYWTIIGESSATLFGGDNESHHTLPLTLLSAHIIANWYLQPLDKYIVSHYDTLYYGRYVDDCMLVVRTRSQSKDDILIAINQELPNLLAIKNNDPQIVIFSFAQNTVAYKRLSTMTIQLDKLYVYRFDCQLPQSSLEQFEDEFRERSSEFRFLTDDVDRKTIGLEFSTLIEALDPSRESGRRFNILEDNKYKLAVYLAKLASRLAYYPGEEKYLKEVEKIRRYFHGNLLIKHYLLWERILSIFILAGKSEYVHAFYDDVQKAIAQLTGNDNIFSDPNRGIANLRESLIRHLNESCLMALSLMPTATLDDIYIRTYMMRMHFNRYPMQEFLRDFKKTGILLPKFKPDYGKACLKYRWMPYYVKYYDIVCMITFLNPEDPNIHEKAYKIYLTLNNISEVDDKCYLNRFMYKQNGDTAREFNTSLNEEQRNHKPITVAIAEIDIDGKDAFDVIRNFGVVDIRKVYDMQMILDCVTAIRNSDIFMLPELSLPIYELRQFCNYAAKQQKAFVAGLEFVVINRYDVINFTITCLPIKMYGRLDAVPVIRTKHHYAPEEELQIKPPFKIGPKDQFWQTLYHWRGHIFTTYYCFELCDIAGRSYFRSKIDAMYAPVFNKDTYYFNNIAESWVRDMHAYFILSNASHLGDSRITQPTSHVYMNIMKVKGGNTKDNRVVVLSGTLNILGLRTFQQFNKTQQKEYLVNHKGKDGFKQLPPGYDPFIASGRDSNYFMLRTGDYEDDFFRWIYEITKMY